ncbi:MAG: hypothetical protein JWM19_4972 [Actinomycetia bacterium]|nr:hypothetical protein [Actinomycetes bacterium]
MPTRDDEILDESLARLARTGPEYRGGLSNHGPMAAEALVRLGRADQVEHWVDSYIQQLDDAPRPSGRITDDTWREALGDHARVADWTDYLASQLADEPWRDVLARWWPRLAPGLAAAATHGIIRTSHAARALNASPSPERARELAHALGYWAATYDELPGTPRTSGQQAPAQAVRGLPRQATRPEHGLISAELRRRLDGDTQLVPAVDALRPPTDVQADLLALGTEFASQFVVYGRTHPIAMLHAVTASVAARSVLPLLPAEVARGTYDRLWQAGAALVSVYSSGAAAEAVPASEPPGLDDLADRAAQTGDAHAIKLTEACLRLHAEHPEPVLLHAAARASELLG